ncbi:MAG: transcriptional repressor LexA [Bacilli bacterium]|nr:transcriptional repressor LexA [Bacilli bacterium]MDD3305279.1 transcriptional repressor LexA [Bacilli bacterium]MDD4053569.1 transcriptional repressor LexA [Bacilli bacterium]MDD4411464.1 transcriptional repressor LexA [Bacilli bacterium]
MEKLTTRQEETLKFIKEEIASNGYPPTVREIGKFLGLSSPATIQVHLSNLENKGYIKKENNKSRAIELLVKNEYANQNDEIVQVPLLGKVTAGSPIEAIERPDEFFALPSYLIPNKKEVFTLNVSGESMINAGIYDGDIVIVQRQNVANNGDIVVAMTDENEVTLKRFYKEKNHIRLQPENDLLKPIILPNVSILGKAIGLYRKL